MPRVMRVVIAGGGTGGHIYPGLAMAQSLQEMDPSVEIHFVGARGGLEERIVPAHGYPLHLVRVGKLHESAGRREQIKTLFLMPLSLLSCLWLALKLRPMAALGVGGYASGPFILIASLLGFRTYLWEPNAQPGWTNRILSRFVRESLVVFEQAKTKIFSRKKRLVGMPVRKEIRKVVQQPSLRGVLRVLVFGGSQGAQAINEAVLMAQEKRPEWWSDVHLVHQTGARDFGRVLKRCEALSRGGERKVVAYIDNMSDRLAWADVVVCRAGASTVAEISAARKAAVFIPFPYAADDHQRKNAEALVEEGAALMILQKDLTPETLMESLEKFKLSSSLREDMQIKLSKFDNPDSGAEIASLLLGRNDE